MSPVNRTARLTGRIFLKLIVTILCLLLVAHTAVDFLASAAQNDTDPPMVAISVRDAGIGIPAEDLPRLFERF